MAKLKLTIEIDVTHYTEEQMLESGVAEDDIEEPDDFESMTHDIGECIVAVLNDPEAIAEGFAGSALFVNCTDAVLLDAEVA